MNIDIAKIAADFLPLVPKADRLARVQQALEVVLKPGARNVEFKNAKSILDHEAEAAFRAATDNFWMGKMGKLDADAQTNDVLNSLVRNVHIYSVRDAISASKKLAKVKLQHPMVAQMRRVVAQVVPLAQAMEVTKAQVVKGRPNAIPSGYVRTRENTGTCPVCFRNIKLDGAQKMVHHGYERPGHGYIVGDCFAVGYRPYELSSEGSKDFLEQVIRPWLTRARKHLKALKGGQITEFNHETVDRTQPRDPRTFKFPKLVVTVKKGDADKFTEPGAHPSFDYLLTSAIANTESEVRVVSQDVREFEGHVANWKLAPLPEAGTQVKEGR